MQPFVWPFVMQPLEIEMQPFEWQPFELVMQPFVMPPFKIDDPYDLRGFHVNHPSSFHPVLQSYNPVKNQVAGGS